MPLKDLIIEDIVAGTGPAVKAGDPVSVHYTGRLEDGGECQVSFRRFCS